MKKQKKRNPSDSTMRNVRLHFRPNCRRECCAANCGGQEMKPKRKRSKAREWWIVITDAPFCGTPFKREEEAVRFRDHLVRGGMYLNPQKAEVVHVREVLPKRRRAKP